jgi:hypothetical protein
MVSKLNSNRKAGEGACQAIGRMYGKIDLQRQRARYCKDKAKAIKQQQLNPQQEVELVDYIGALTKRVLPPTREMIQILPRAWLRRLCGGLGERALSTETRTISDANLFVVVSHQNCHVEYYLYPRTTVSAWFSHCAYLLE